MAARKSTVTSRSARKGTAAGSTARARRSTDTAIGKRRKAGPSRRAEAAQYVRIVREITGNHALDRLVIPAIASPDGIAHFYLNAAVPRDPHTQQPLAPLTAGICAVCGHAYADLIRKASKIAQNNPKNGEIDPKSPEITENRLVCDECKGDAWFERVLDLEKHLNIRLDTGTAHGRDLRFEREKYDFKSSQTRQIKHLAEEANARGTRVGNRKSPRTND